MHRSAHSFHSSCVETWFRSTPHKARSCPHCRQNPLRNDGESAHTDTEVAIADMPSWNADDPTVIWLEGWAMVPGFPNR